MFFRRREEKPVCFHEWRVADFGVGYEYNGIDEDSYDYYVIGCEKCGDSRRIGSYEYSRMKSNEMLKGGA